MIPRYYYKQLWHDSHECCQCTRFYLNKKNSTDMSLSASWMKNLKNIKKNISETFFTVFSRVTIWAQANVSLVGISTETGGIMVAGITGARILIG